MKLLLLCGLIYCVVASENKVRNQIYLNVKEHRNCFRILNGTHQIGCQSSVNGNQGIVHVIQQIEDVTWIINDVGKHAPFVAVLFMNSFLFTVSTMLKLKASRNVAGYLIIRDRNSEPPSNSDDYACPDSLNGLYSNNSVYGGCAKNVWNSPGDAMWFQNWDVPIFVMSNTNETNLLVEKCYNDFNKPINGTPRSYPLCATDLQFRMFAAVNAPTCLRRSNLFSKLDSSYNEKICDAVEDFNIYGFVPPTDKEEPLDEDSVLVLSTRMDSFSMYADSSPGSQAALAGYITLLAVAHAIGELQKSVTTSAPGKLFFVFFNGESLNYIGSSRLTWEMGQGTFPKKLDPKLNQSAIFNISHIGAWIEIGQMAARQAGRFHLHTDPAAYNASKSKIVSSLTRTSPGVFLGPDPSFPLPPASVQSVLRERPGFPSVVITDYATEFHNKYYHSLLDDPSRLNLSMVQESMFTLGTSVAKFAYQWLFQKTPPADLKVDLNVINSLVDCFHGPAGAECDLLAQIVRSVPSTAKAVRSRMKFPFSTYPGPFTQTHLPRYFASYILPYFLAIEKIEWNVSDLANCQSSKIGPSDHRHSYDFMYDLLDSESNASFCIKSSVFLSHARSPAFDIDGYNWTSGQYSTWVESVWASKPRLRLFLVPNPTWSEGIFALGFIVFIISMVVMYLLDQNADLLFNVSSVSPVAL